MAEKKKTTVELGQEGERKAVNLLNMNGYNTFKIKGYSCVDLIAEKNDIKYGINVKTGKHYLISGSALNKMIKFQEICGLPSFLLLNGEGCYLFILSKMFPPINDFLPKTTPHKSFQKLFGSTELSPPSHYALNKSYRNIWVEEEDYDAIFEEVNRRKRVTHKRVSGAEVLHEWLEERRLYMEIEAQLQTGEEPGSAERTEE